MTWTKKMLAVGLFISMAYITGCGQTNQSFLPPLLSDTSGLQELVSLDPQALEIQKERSGHFLDQKTFMGHVIALGAGASLELSINSSMLAGIALYGPRDSHGLFGKALQADSTSSGHASMVSTQLDEGDYLILIADIKGVGGEYRLLASCNGACQEAKCPALVCGKYCATGLQHDEDGCPSCACAPGCMNDSDCPLDFSCLAGVCNKTQDSCNCSDEPYSPVCGTDRNTYANRCELDCAGVQLASEGACQDLQCSSDDDCPNGMQCVEHKCVSRCDCDNEAMDEQCGTDGLTYFNECERSCAGVGLEHQGPCDICNPEICADGIDNDCDGFIDEGCDEACSSDADCPAGKVCMGGICAGTITCADDADCPANQFCQASTSTCRAQDGCTPEICDGLDNDCDGTVDEGCPACRSNSDCEQSELCINGVCKAECDDLDQDGFTDSACGGQDCDDHDPNINPSAEEICDGIDDDCDGQTDEDCVQPCSSDADCAAGEICLEGQCVTGECDADGDGFTSKSCGGTDCDDEDPTVNTAAQEICDAKDNDCDGDTDESCGLFCRTDEECETMQVCVNNLCTSSCSSDSDCPQSWHCNISSGFCEP